MVQFHKLTRNLFLTLQGNNAHCQQRKLSKFLMRYQQFASLAYCGAAGPVSKMASQQEKAFCVLRFEVSRSAITVQRADSASAISSSKLCTKLTLHCNHRCGHLKTEYTERFFLLRRHLGNWPRSKHEKRTVGSALETCCWQCALCPCKVRNQFLVSFWNCTILLCIPCTRIYNTPYTTINKRCISQPT
jgi:hypothetical protein